VTAADPLWTQARCVGLPAQSRASTYPAILECRHRQDRAPMHDAHRPKGSMGIQFKSR
jgi:hypothetical protein